jgi:hypothetical protein
MDTKKLIVRELDNVEDAFLNEVLHYVRFLKTQYELELEADLEDAETALEEAKREGTVPWEQVKQELGL